MQIACRGVETAEAPRTLASSVACERDGGREEAGARWYQENSTCLSEQVAVNITHPQRELRQELTRQRREA